MPFSLPFRRSDLIITLLGLIGAVLFFSLYDQAFPAAALDLKLSRAEIEQRANQILGAYAYDPAGYKFALNFSEDGMSSIYIQRTLGVAETNQRIQRESLPIWYWQARWFRPEQQEEFHLQLSPLGQVVGFWHTIPEDAPGENLTQEQARQRAEAYLTHGMGLKLDEWEPVSASSEARPNRTDHTFIWKLRAFRLGESEHRISVSLHGDRVDGYNDWIKIPEEFTRDYQAKRNRASLLDSLSTLLGVSGFSLAAFVAVLVSYWRRRRIGRAAWIAVLLVCVVAVPAGLNALPLYKASYSTTESYTQFWFEILLYGALGGAALLLFILILWEGGDRLARLAWPRQDKILPLEGSRWANFTASAWRGLMLAGTLGGYVVGFYWLVTRFLGAWTPMDVDYSNIYATPLPALFAIASGILPGIEEEAMFRLTGISLIKSITRRTWLALFIPGLLFAFAHASYVTEPYYLRGIELLIPAVLLEGLFFLRYGLVTTVIAHVTYNVTLGMLPMLRSGEPYFVFNGLLVALVLLAPLLLGLWQTWRRRKQPSLTPTIQPAGPADCPGLEALTQGGDWAGVLQSPTSLVYSLQVGGQVVGAAVGQLKDSFQDEPQANHPSTGTTGELSFLYVAPAWRGRYWGSRLTDAVLQALQQKGAGRIRASVAADNQALFSFLTGQRFITEQHILVLGRPVPLSEWLRAHLPVLWGVFKRHSA